MHIDDIAAPTSAQTGTTGLRKKPELNDAQRKLAQAIIDAKGPQEAPMQAFAAARARECFRGRHVRGFWSPIEETVLRRETEDFYLRLCNEAETALMESGFGPKKPVAPSGYMPIVGIEAAMRMLRPDGQMGPARTPEEVAQIEEYEADSHLHHRAMQAHRRVIGTWIKEGMLTEMEKFPDAEKERAAENEVLRAAVGEVQGLPEGGDRGGDLLDGDTPEIDWLADGMLPASGLLLTAGRPKGGKSTLIYQTLYCVTTGLPFLDVRVKAPVKAALISVDDPNKARVRRRFQILRTMMPGASDPEVQEAFKANMVETYYDWHKGERFLPALAKLLREQPEVKIVAVDAYANIKKPQKNSGALFDGDYAELAEMRKFAHEHGILLLLAIHTRKAQSFAGDPIDEVQGTSGVTAAVDDLWGIRFDAKLGRTLLSTKGRNLDQEVHELSFIPAPKASGGGGYFIIEAAQPVLASTERRVLHALATLTSAATLRTIASAAGVRDASSIQHAVDRLVEKKIVARQPKEKGYGFVYELSVAGRAHVEESGKLDGEESPF